MSMNILAVRSARPRQASRILRRDLAGPVRVSLFGDSIHIVCQDRDQTKTRARLEWAMGDQKPGEYGQKSGENPDELNPISG